jgi:hypothetical protein
MRYPPWFGPVLVLRDIGKTVGSSTRNKWDFITRCNPI